MHGWTHLDTARCERCRVYIPTTELVFSASGRSFCTDCGVQKTTPPPAPPRTRVYVPVADVAWAEPYPRTRLEHHARVAALVMLAVTLCFPLAACVSQL